MKLLSANLIITSLSEQKRLKQELIIPTVAASIIFYPLWGANLSTIASNLMPMISSVISSTTTLTPELAGMDGFAAYAYAQKTSWQVQSSATPSNTVPPSSLNAQPSKGGLVGAVVDPAFAQASECGMLADYGYDTARDISRCVTFATALLAICFFCVILRATRKKGELTKRKIAKAVFYISILTGIVHMVGTFLINNF
jgi:hypothetical protein